MTSTLPNDNIRNFDDQITNKLISEIIRDRIKSSGKRFSANDNISDFINPGELEILEKEVASRVKDLLKSLVIDVENDHNTQETAERVSKMYLNEVFKGRYHEQPKVTSFPNDKNLATKTPINALNKGIKMAKPIKNEPAFFSLGNL